MSGWHGGAGRETRRASVVAGAIATLGVVVAGCGSASSASINCREVKASTERTHALAKIVIEEVRSAVPGSTPSLLLADNVLNAACARLKPEDRPLRDAVANIVPVERTFKRAGEERSAQAQKQREEQRAERKRGAEEDLRMEQEEKGE
jgi:hypothetical protein